LLAVVAALLLAVGLTACGGGGDSSSTSAEAGSQGQSEGKSDGGASQNGSAKSGGSEGKSGSGAGEGKSGGSDGEAEGSGEASHFVPKHHHDSGGGSKQFQVKGGDNSVQEFGGEADPSEFDAAAVALHNFLDARAESNWAAACDYLAKSVTEGLEKLAAQAKQVEATTCGEILEKLTNPAAKQSLSEEAAKANVGSLRVEGEQAFVIYTGLDGTVMAIPMANEGGSWKVASLAGTPLS
jgi:hypothetical protein